MAKPHAPTSQPHAYSQKPRQHPERGGYERVIVYRFDTDWNGQAIAEDKVVDWDTSLIGITFPASDIPVQARELYRHSPMRWVVDRDAAPAPLDIDPAWTGGAPLPRAIDLSFTHLRSLSPVHMQIHRNLGINGSMSAWCRDQRYGRTDPSPAWDQATRA